MSEAEYDPLSSSEEVQPASAPLDAEASRSSADSSAVPPPNWFMLDPWSEGVTGDTCCAALSIPYLTSCLVRAIDSRWFCTVMYVWLGLAPFAAALPQFSALVISECVHDNKLLDVWHTVATFAFCLPWPFLFDGLHKVVHGEKKMGKPEYKTDDEDLDRLERDLSSVDAKTSIHRKISELRVARSFNRIHRARLTKRINIRDEQLEGSAGALHWLRRSEWGEECDEELADLCFDLFRRWRLHENKDEKITVEDLQTVLVHMREEPGRISPQRLEKRSSSVSRVRKMLAEYDTNHDGVLDRREFLEMVRALPAPKKISKKTAQSLSNKVCIVATVGLVMFIITLCIGVGLINLILEPDKSNIDANLDQLGQPARGVLDHFLPNDGCIADAWISRFTWLLLVVTFPAALVASFIVPAWLLSVHLGVALAADCVDDVLCKLNPLPDDSQSQDDRLLRGDFTDDGAWEQRVQHPVSMVVETMGHLSDWGTAMGAAVFSYFLFAFTMLPLNVNRLHSGRPSLWSFFACVVNFMFFAIPFFLAWGPATVSSACDDLLDQLNDLSFLGTVAHRERCTRLRASLMNLQRNQGLGFHIFGTVVDKRMLGKIILGGCSATVSLVTTMLAVAESEDDALATTDTNGSQP